MTPRYMLDTNICIYIAKQQPPKVKTRFERMKPGEVVMSAITYGELYYGASKSRQSSAAFAQLQLFVRDVPVVAVDLEAAKVYGEVRSLLEWKGQLIGNNDLWIGAHALALGVTLATNNEREFRRVPRLAVENWTE